MIGFYALRGQDWDKVASAPATVKEFLLANMSNYYDDEVEKYKALFGGGK